MIAHRTRALVVSATLAVACNEGLSPVPTCNKGICGTVTFVGAVPESTLAVYVIAFPNLPQSISDLTSFQPPFSDLISLPLDSASARYAIAVPAGRYEWVLAVWLKLGFTFANAESTVYETGFYRDGADTTQLGSGIVTVSGTGRDSINFVIDYANKHPVSYYFPPLATRP